MATVVHPFLQEGLQARAYQLRSVERALSQSSLMVMPTGFGKTAVEWMVMAERFRQQQTPIILIAPTTGLVEQHVRGAIERLTLTAEQIIAYTGELSPAQRQVEWGQHLLYIATPQVIRNDAMSGLIDLRQIQGIIFDEAHHATGSHAYAQVGRLFHQANPTGWVLGATASPGSTKQHILDVKTNIATPFLDVSRREEPLLAPYDADMSFDERYIELPTALETLIHPIQRLIDDEIEHLKRSGFLPAKAYITTMDIEKGQQRASRAIQQRDVRGYDAARRVADLRRLYLLNDLLRTQGTFVAKAFLDRAEHEGREGRKTNRFLSLPVIHDLRKNLKVCSELLPKIESVEALIQQEISSNPEGRILIFTEYRDTVSCLVSHLSDATDARVDQFIGQSTRGKQRGMSQKEQIQQLDKFRSGEINILVATSVGEEGLDVPDADLVVLYEPVPSAIRAIQRRGRTARQKAGQVVVFISQNSRDVYVHSASKKQEERMHAHLAHLTRQRLIDVDFAINEGALDFFEIRNERNVQESATSFVAAELGRMTSTQQPIKPQEHHATSEAQPTIPVRTFERQPHERRPSSQSGLDSFFNLTQTEYRPPNEQSQPILNATKAEIDSLSSIDVENETIIIDHREANSTLPGLLKSLGYTIQFSHLEVGDIRLSSRVLIERKSSRDILASIKDGRLIHQCLALSARCVRPILLIETGTEGSYALHPNAVLGAMAFITGQLGIPIMMTKSPMESSHFIALLKSKEGNLVMKFQNMIHDTSWSILSDEALQYANEEIRLLTEQPESSHPWFDSYQESLNRCFESFLDDFNIHDDSIRHVLLAFSPDITQLICASVEAIIEKSKCERTVAEQAYELLHA